MSWLLPWTTGRGKTKMTTTPKPGEPQSLPTNLETATRENIRSSLPSLAAKILTRRAQRLRVSEEEASRVESKPLFMVEIERRAAAEGRTVESVLEEYSRRLEQSTYPTRDCFLPDEVAEYANHALSADRLAHANACAPCATLLASAVPSDRAARELVEAIRSMPSFVEDGFEDLTAATATNNWPAFNLAAAKRWAGVVLVPVFALTLMYFTFLRMDTSATRLTYLHSPVMWIVAAVAATLFTLSVFEVRRPVYRSLAVGGAFAAVLGCSFFIDFRRSQSNRDFAIKFAQDQVATLAAASIENRQTTGKFLDFSHSSDLFQIETPQISNSQVRYVATSRQLPGKIVADIGDHGGDLKWEYGNKTVQQLELLTGTLENNAGALHLRLSNGHIYAVPITDRLRNLPPNTEVLAFVDPATSSLRSVRIFDRSSGRPAVQTIDELEVPFK